MIGRADKALPAHTLWLAGDERSNLGPALAKRGAKILADPHPEQNFFSRSDNIQLARRGVIAQTISSFGLHTDYQQPSDEVKTIDFPHRTDSIRSMLSRPVAGEFEVQTRVAAWEETVIQFTVPRCQFPVARPEPGHRKLATGNFISAHILESRPASTQTRGGTETII